MSRGDYPSIDDLRSTLDYDQATGAMTWRRTTGRCRAGSPVGKPDKASGHLVFKFQTLLRRVHAVAWLLSDNMIPSGKVVEHVNGVAVDNRLANLRLSRDYEPLSVELIRRLFRYDAETGRLIHACDYGKRQAGAAAGFAHGAGYLLVAVEGSNYLVHRIVWAYIHGALLMPRECIDHINGIRHDNRPANLRVVTHTENMQNMHTVNGGRPIDGAHFDVARGRWKSSISINGRVKHLGRFDSREDARAAYLSAKRKFHAPNVIAGTIDALAPLRSGA